MNVVIGNLPFFSGAFWDRPGASSPRVLRAGMDPLPTLKLRFASSRKNLADVLRKRCEKSCVDKEAKLWKNAWKRFKIESNHFIPRPKCFSLSDKSATKDREVYKRKYRILAVKHFLPYYKKKVAFLKGDIKVRY